MVTIRRVHATYHPTITRTPPSVYTGAVYTEYNLYIYILHVWMHLDTPPIVPCIRSIGVLRIFIQGPSVYAYGCACSICMWKGCEYCIEVVQGLLATDLQSAVLRTDVEVEEWEEGWDTEQKEEGEEGEIFVLYVRSMYSADHYWHHIDSSYICNVPGVFSRLSALLSSLLFSLCGCCVVVVWLEHG